MSHSPGITKRPLRSTTLADGGTLAVCDTATIWSSSITIVAFRVRLPVCMSITVAWVKARGACASEGKATNKNEIASATAGSRMIVCVSPTSDMCTKYFIERQLDYIYAEFSAVTRAVPEALPPVSPSACSALDSARTGKSRDQGVVAPEFSRQP